MKIKIRGSHSLIALILGLIAYGCHFPSDIGFGDNNSQTAFYTDTLSLNYSTVLANTAYNGNSAIILTGKVKDPELGAIEAISYFQPSLSPLHLSTGAILTDDEGNVVFDTLSVPAGAIIDSLKLRLYSNEIAFGDTAKLAKFTIHRLKNVLSTKDYNYSEVQEYDPEPIAEFDYSYTTMRDEDSGYLKVKFVDLPIDLAHELINTVKEANYDNSQFIQKFRGFAIVPDPNNEAVYGFSTGTLDLGGAGCSIIPYWHVEGDTISDVYVMNINGPRYSHLDFNRENTVLRDLTLTNNELPASATNERIYLQGGSGISPKIDLSPLSKLGKIKISKAVLEFNANSGVINDLYRTHKYFVLAEVGENNQQKRDENNALNYILGSNNELIGEYFTLVDSSKYLNIDITRYLQKLEAENNLNKQILLLPALANTQTGTGTLSNDNLSRMVFLKPRLLLYYNRY